MVRMAADSEVPDTVMPVQYFTRSAWTDTPEKRLILAVLMDAITQLQSGDAQDVVEAESWIRHETDNAAISFVDACDALGLEAGGLADRLVESRTRRRFVPRARYRVARFGRLRARGAAKAAAPSAEMVGRQAPMRSR